MTSDTVEEGVLKVLKAHPEARNNYNWLWYWYCREVSNIPIYVPFEALNEKKIPSVESITRACRKIQNDKKRYQPAFEVQEARKNNEVRVREWALKNKAPIPTGWMFTW